MKKILIGCFIVIGLTSFARIGESESQCDDRYFDSSTKQPKPRMNDRGNGVGMKYYHKNDIRIEATFYNGKCVILKFFKAPPESIEGIVEANKGNSKWNKTETKLKTVWEREDKGAIAEKIVGSELTITDTAYIKIQESQKTANAKTATKGF